jgi:cell division protein FtsB
MARTLFAAPIDPATAAQLASLRARVSQLEAEVATLRAASSLALDAELEQVAAERAALA